MSDKVVHSRSTSPVDSNERPQQHKKRRKALSCNECRRRKLKCDRTYPTCTRCQKSGDAELCVYETTPKEAIGASDQTHAIVITNTENPAISTNSTPHHAGHHHRGPDHHFHHPPPCHQHKGRDDVHDDDDVMLGRRRARREKVVLLENRIASLEGMLARQTDVSRTALLRQKGDAGSNEAFFRGKGFRTQYYGPSSPSGLFPRFRELKGFMKETSLTDDTLRRMKKDYGDFLNLHEKYDTSVMAGNDSDLFRLLPSKLKTDHAVSVYMSSLESIYCILHKPTFWSEYEEFWNEAENSKNCRPGFAALLLLILATVNCAATQEPFSIIGYSSPARQQAVHWIEVSEAWLNRHSQKHLTVTLLQAHCLLLIAKVVNSIKTKRIWTLTGNTLRFSMSVGLHLDPGRLADRISIFNQEIRRRLWATMMELELQACINRGMPSCLESTQLDCAAPANINDSELMEDGSALPASRCPKTFTDASFLHAARQSLPLRIQLTTLINSPISRLSVEEILSFEDRITDLISSIPSWTNTKAESEASLCAKIMLDIQLRHFLLLLHTQLDSKEQSQSRSDYSRMVCFNSAYKILDHYQTLSSKSQPLLLLYTSDVLNVAASLCHNILLSNNSSNILLANVFTSAGEFVEKALRMLEDKAIRLGTGFMQCWFIISAFAFAQPGVTTDKNIRQKQLRYAVDRNIQIYERVLALQVRPPGWNEPLTNGSTVFDTPSSANNNNFQEMALPVDNLMMDQDGIGLDLGFDLADFSEWTFNDWVAAPWLPPVLDK